MKNSLYVIVCLLFLGLTLNGITVNGRGVFMVVSGWFNLFSDADY